MKKHIHVIALLSLIFTLENCKKDNNSTPANTNYTVPTTYNFDNVNTTNQQKLLLMADQIVATINFANTSPATTVSAQRLKDMFNNVNGYFVDSSLGLNNSGLKLSDYCSPDAKTDLMSYFDSVGVFSQSAAVASEGVAGVAASSANASKKYLLSSSGVFYSQVVKKAIMTGICGYEIAQVYLADSISSSVDNNTVVTGNGTAMEHHWDEAFGFFSVPIDFPTNTKGAKYLASYSSQVDAGLHSNANIMNAFLKGRAAISNKDMATKTAQAATLVSLLDALNAACIVQEMKETDANIEANDAVAAYGTLSETLGFVRNFKYMNSNNRKITDAQLAQLEALFDNTNPANPNLYRFIDFNTNSTAQLEAKTDAIRQFIGNIYGFNATVLSQL